MSMGTPGWNPGADAMRAQQENDRLNRESARRMHEDAMRNAQDNARNARFGGFGAVPRRRSGRLGRFMGLLVVLVVAAAMFVFVHHQVSRSQDLPGPTDPACGVVATDC